MSNIDYSYNTQAAKSRSLYDYMINNHPDMVIKQGKSLRLQSNHSVSITRNYYTDFGSTDKGDNISFLQNYLGMTFTEAVSALLSVSESYAPTKKSPKFELPKKAANNSRIIQYLTIERGLDNQIINWLISKGVLYQDDYCNCVFISPNNDFFELRGIFNKPFHKNADKSPNNSGYWYFNSPDARVLTKAFVCESAIDATSLFLLKPDDGYYFSIAGVGNQQRIDAIKNLGLMTYTAFDNDLAGQQARERNMDVKHLIPEHKDWNEDLRHITKR